MTIVKLLGPSGAGKTTAVRELMDMAYTVTVMSRNSRGKPLVYMLDFEELEDMVYVIGSYESNCGGVDTVGTAKEAMELVDTFALMGHVVFEGLLQSTYYGAMGEWSTKYGQDFVYAWIDTPQEVAMQRLIARRAEQGTTRPLNVAQAEAKWESVWAAFQKAITRGHRTAVLDHTQSLGRQLESLL